MLFSVQRGGWSISRNGGEHSVEKAHTWLLLSVGLPPCSEGAFGKTRRWEGNFFSPRLGTSLFSFRRAEERVSSFFFSLSLCVLIKNEGKQKATNRGSFYAKISMGIGLKPRDTVSF